MQPVGSSALKQKELNNFLLCVQRGVGCPHCIVQAVFELLSKRLTDFIFLSYIFKLLPTGFRYPGLYSKPRCLVIISLALLLRQGLLCSRLALGPPGPLVSHCPPPPLLAHSALHQVPNFVSVETMRGNSTYKTALRKATLATQMILRLSY